MNKVIAVGKCINKEVIIMKAEWWYESKLQRYFDKHYGVYDEVAEWYINPAPNKWKFDIPDLASTVLLTCDDRGIVTETREILQK